MSDAIALIVEQSPGQGDINSEPFDALRQSAHEEPIFRLNVLPHSIHMFFFVRIIDLLFVIFIGWPLAYFLAGSFFSSSAF